MIRTDVKQLVSEALDRAYANNFNMCDMDDISIAEDLIHCESTLERFDVNDLIPGIESWKYD